MTVKDLFDIKHILHDLCKEVGAYQMLHLGRKDLLVDAKTSSVDLVTEIDKGSEEKIIACLKEYWPDHGLLAEESGETPSDSEYLWVIDPVDGTTNYAHGYPLFAISIGLQQNGETILGTIYVPALDEFYWAIKGEGAYVNERQIHVSDAKSLSRSVIAPGFPYSRATTKHNNVDYVGHMVPIVTGIRRSGSACVDLISVAHGRLDGYFEMYLNPWDFIAGQLIVREAGGSCEVRYVRERYSVVCTNGLIDAEFRSELSKVGTGDY